MTIKHLRAALAMLLAGLVLAGCTSTGTQEPAEPATADPAPASQEPEPAPAPPPPKPEPKTTDAAGNPLDMATGQTLGRLFYFDFDKAIVKSDARALLTRHARFLRDNPGRNVLLAGHADERGTREYNLALGERRADAVRSYLLAQGVRRGQMETVSYGEERPVDPRSTESAWAKNRRVEIIYR